MKKQIKILIILIFGITLLATLSTAFGVNMPFDPEYDENNLINNDEIKERAANSISNFVFLVQIISVATLVIMGLRYMLTSAEGKAEIKKEFMGWTIGAIIVFSGTTIAGLVLNVVTGKNYVTIAKDPVTDSGSSSGSTSASGGTSGSGSTEEFDDETVVSNWADEYWEKAKSIGILPASIMNTPKSKITRIEFVEAIHLLTGKYGLKLESGSSGLNTIDVADIPSNSVKNKELKRIILDLYSMGIVSGVEEDSDGNIIFEPNSKITREDVSTIIYRLLQKLGKSGSVSITDEDRKNTIYDSVSDYAKDAMIFVNKAGIIVGDEKGNLNPRGYTTCEEAITILYRIYTGEE